MSHAMSTSGSLGRSPVVRHIFPMKRSRALKGSGSVLERDSMATRMAEYATTEFLQEKEKYDWQTESSVR